MATLKPDTAVPTLKEDAAINAGIAAGSDADELETPLVVCGLATPYFHSANPPGVPAVGQRRLPPPETVS